MDMDTFKQGLLALGPSAVALSFVAGLVFSFNPVALAVIPVSLAYVTKGRDKTDAWLFGTMFVAGMILTHVMLGLAAGLSGAWVASLIGRHWGLVLGPFLILLGFLWIGWIPLPRLPFGLTGKRPSQALGAFALGVPFAVAICPVCTPALVVMLGAVAGIGSPQLGAILLLAFALGRAVPLLAGAWSLGWLQNLGAAAPFRKAFEIVGGVLFVGAGLYLLNAYFFWVPSLAI